MIRLLPSMNALVSARLVRAERLSSFCSPVAVVISRFVLPVTSATSSVPKWRMISSSAVDTAGSAHSCSIIASRMATASALIAGLPSASTAGRDRRKPSSSQ